MREISMLVFDIDGVITDGKRYLYGNTEIKGYSLKDLDAIGQFRDIGYIVCSISGEDTQFSRQFVQTVCLDWVKLGCREKEMALKEAASQYGIPLEQVCYVGDGKYDIPALRIAGLAACPADAIEEVREVANVVLARKGGEGCLSEIYTLLSKKERVQNPTYKGKRDDMLMRRMEEHLSVVTRMMEHEDYLAQMREASRIIVECCGHHGKFMVCGDEKEGTDARHLAGELAGRCSLKGQGLATNTVAVTAWVNDEVLSAWEAQASRGDVLIGITTGGGSKRIRQAFRKAKGKDVITILMTGEIADDADILQDTDCLLSVPTKDAWRIQEMHILMGHMICELTGREFAENIE